MKLPSAFILSALLLSGCGASRLADEPADLLGPGRTITELTKLGWRVSPPMSPEQAARVARLTDSSQAFGGESWKSFLDRMLPGDELRQIGHNAGEGFAIFRSGTYVGEYLIVVF